MTPTQRRLLAARKARLARMSEARLTVERAEQRIAALQAEIKELRKVKKTAYRRAYRSQPEVMAKHRDKQRDYAARPEIKARRRDPMRKLATKLRRCGLSEKDIAAELASF